MKDMLKKQFDYQRFEKNEKLEKLIQETESRYAKELSDDDLFLVNAAGEIPTCPGTAKGNAFYPGSGSGGTENPFFGIENNNGVFDKPSNLSDRWLNPKDNK